MTDLPVVATGVAAADTTGSDAVEPVPAQSCRDDSSGLGWPPPVVPSAERDEYTELTGAYTA